MWVAARVVAVEADPHEPILSGRAAGGGGADVSPLARSGTPVSELSPDPQRYFDLHHARSDVFEKVNKRELLLGAVNMAALIYLVDKYGL